MFLGSDGYDCSDGSDAGDCSTVMCQDLADLRDRLQYPSSSSDDDMADPDSAWIGCASGEDVWTPDEDSWTTASSGEFSVATPNALRIGLMRAGLSKDSDPSSPTPGGMSLWCSAPSPPPRVMALWCGPSPLPVPSTWEQRLARTYAFKCHPAGGKMQRGTWAALDWVERCFPGADEWDCVSRAPSNELLQFCPSCREGRECPGQGFLI
jgi:hypothetical protein